MFGWWRELLEIRYEFRARNAELQHERCDSCEVLKQQLALANNEKEKLLNRLIEKPAPEPQQPPVEIGKPKNIPWTVRRQMLEQEDREKARLMREAPVPESTKDLEKELGVSDAAG